MALSEHEEKALIQKYVKSLASLDYHSLCNIKRELEREKAQIEKGIEHIKVLLSFNDD